MGNHRQKRRKQHQKQILKQIDYKYNNYKENLQVKDE